jgi:hypothetical protein
MVFGTAVMIAFGGFSIWNNKQNEALWTLSKADRNLRDLFLAGYGCAWMARAG